MYAKLIIIGNLGRDPEQRHAPSGDLVTNFSVATSERWKDKAGEAQERTTWVDCAAWGKLAEISAQYLRKGSRVYIEGSPSVRPFVTRDNEAGASLGCRVRELKFLTPKDQQGDGASPQQSLPGTDRPALKVREPASTRPPSQRQPQTATTAAPPPERPPETPQDFDDDIPF